MPKKTASEVKTTKASKSMPETTPKSRQTKLEKNSDKLSKAAKALGMAKSKKLEPLKDDMPEEEVVEESSESEENESEEENEAEENEEESSSEDDANADKKASKKKNLVDALASKDGIIYLGHIPHGFYENEMKGFFSQFGVVKNLRLSRSRKTGRSRGYAFIQFESKEVASVVRDAMDKYILCGKLLTCELVEPEHVSENIFKISTKTFSRFRWAKYYARKHNMERTLEQQKMRNTRAKKRQMKQLEKLKNNGINYKFTGGYGAA